MGTHPLMTVPTRFPVTPVLTATSLSKATYIPVPCCLTPVPPPPPPPPPHPKSIIISGLSYDLTPIKFNVSQKAKKKEGGGGGGGGGGSYNLEGNSQQKGVTYPPKKEFRMPKAKTPCPQAKSILEDVKHYISPSDLKTTSKYGQLE